MFKKEVTIRGEHYIAEFSSNQRGFFITLFSLKDPKDNKVMELNDDEILTNILKTFNYDYEYMARHLDIVNNQIKIKDPKSVTDK